MISNLSQNHYFISNLAIFHWFQILQIPQVPQINFKCFGALFGCSGDKISYEILIWDLPKRHFLYCNLEIWMICWEVESHFFIRKSFPKKHAAGSAGTGDTNPRPNHTNRACFPDDVSIHKANSLKLKPNDFYWYAMIRHWNDFAMVIALSTLWLVCVLLVVQWNGMPPRPPPVVGLCSIGGLRAVLHLAIQPHGLYQKIIRFE